MFNASARNTLNLMLKKTNTTNWALNVSLFTYLYPGFS